jgi:1-acyl-sn-glycerol-3-phosphate acyltransferase
MWINWKRPNVDYSKYLGPDWKPDYDSSSTFVCNHSSWADILTLVLGWNLGFVAKIETKKYPLIGQIAEITGAFFMNRTASKEEKE